MQKLLICLLALRLTVSNKLDRAYLPPPGAKYSGGSPEDLQVPLEFPKETHHSTIEPQTEPNNRKQTLGNDENLRIGTNSRNDGEKTSNDRAFETFLNTSPIPIPSNKFTPTAYSTDESYGASLDSNLGFPRSFPNAPLQTSSTSTEHSESQETTTTKLLLASGISNQQPFSIYQSPARSRQNILGKNSYKSNDESDLYQNQHPGNIEFDIQTGNQTVLNMNQLPRYQDTAYVQNNLISAKSRPDFSNPDFQIETSAKDDKNNTFMLPSNQKSLLVYKQNKNDENNGEYDKNYLNKPELTPVDITLSDDFSREISSTYLTSSTEAAIEKSMDSHIVINNRPERLQTAVDRSSVILNYRNVITPEEFSYSFDTSNGIHAEESGTTIDRVKAQGAYSYTGDDGKVYSVIYTADENGFQPHGDHLPTPPPAPIYIQKLLKEVAMYKEIGNFDDGSYDDAKYGYKKYQGAMDRYSPEIQGVSFEGIKLFGEKKKINSHNSSLTKVEKSSSKYEDDNENKFNSGNTEPHVYNNHLSMPPLNKLFENDIDKITSDTNGEINVMKSTFPELKAYTKHTDLLSKNFEVSGTDGIQNHQQKYTITSYSQYLNENQETENKNQQDGNKPCSNIYSPPPIIKLNDQINIGLANYDQAYGVLSTTNSSMYNDLNSGYRYDKPEIKFSHEFTEDLINVDQRSNLKYINPTKSTSDNASYNKTARTGGIGYTKNANRKEKSKFEPKITSQDVDHKNINSPTISVSNKTRKMGISRYPQIIARPYQESTLHGRNLIQKQSLTSGQNIDDSFTENISTSGYLYVPFTTPISSQNATFYSETEPTTSKLYPTTFITTDRPRTNYYVDINATEYPVDTIEPSTMPPRSEISQGFENSKANVVVDGFGRPIKTEQPDREYTGYVSGSKYSTTMENDDIDLNLPTIINNDDSEDSKSHSVDDMKNIPYDAMKNFQFQVAGLKDSKDNSGEPRDFGSLITEVFVENHSTTESPIGEDFSGPKQLQTYDPETGYSYK